MMMMLAKQVLLLRDEQKWQINYESDDSKAQWLLASPRILSVSTSLHGSLRYFYPSEGHNWLEAKIFTEEVLTKKVQSFSPRYPKLILDIIKPIPMYSDHNKDWHCSASSKIYDDSNKNSAVVSNTRDDFFYFFGWKKGHLASLEC